MKVRVRGVEQRVACSMCSNVTVLPFFFTTPGTDVSAGQSNSRRSVSRMSPLSPMSTDGGSAGSNATR